MLWKLTRVGEVGMDMARATRARMECLSCHRCHLFRMAERTCGRRADHSVGAQSQGAPPSPRAAISSCIGKQLQVSSAQVWDTGVRCAEATEEHCCNIVDLHICWDTFFKCPGEGVPFSNPHKLPSPRRTPTFNLHAPPALALSFLVFNNPFHGLMDETEAPGRPPHTFMSTAHESRGAGLPLQAQPGRPVHPCGNLGAGRRAGMWRAEGAYRPSRPKRAPAVLSPSPGSSPRC